MTSVKMVKLIKAIMESNIPIEWFSYIVNQNSRLYKQSEDFIKSNNLDYFNLRFFEFIKQNLGIEALKMPILDLISALKYIRVIDIEKEEMSNLI